MAPCKICGQQRDWLVLNKARGGVIQPAEQVKGPLFEVTSVCPLGHAVTSRPDDEDDLHPTDGQSTIIGFWGSGAAGKTHLMRRLISVKFPSSDGLGKPLRLGTKPQPRLGVQQFAPPGMGIIAVRTAADEMTCLNILLAYIASCGIARGDNDIFLRQALAQKGLSDTEIDERFTLWSNEHNRPPVVKAYELRDRSAGRSRNIQLCYRDEPGELHNLTDAHGKAAGDVTGVLLVLDPSISMRLHDSPADRLMLALSSRPASADLGPLETWKDENLRRMNHRQKVEDHQRQSRNSCQSATDWLLLKRGTGHAAVVLTKLDLVYRLLIDLVGGGADSAAAALFDDEYDDVVEAAASHLGRLARHWGAEGHRCTPSMVALLEQVPTGAGAEARYRRVARAIIDTFFEPTAFWDLVLTGVMREFAITDRSGGERTFTCESVDSLHVDLLTAGADLLHVRDLVCGVVGRALTSWMDDLGATEPLVQDDVARPERYFLTALIDPRKAGADTIDGFNKQLTLDTKVNGGVKHLAGWMLFVNMTIAWSRG